VCDLCEVVWCADLFLFFFFDFDFGVGGCVVERGKPG
jgi:hypothetical protein